MVSGHSTRNNRPASTAFDSLIDVSKEFDRLVEVEKVGAKPLISGGYASTMFQGSSKERLFANTVTSAPLRPLYITVTNSSRTPPLINSLKSKKPTSMNKISAKIQRIGAVPQSNTRVSSSTTLPSTTVSSSGNHISPSSTSTEPSLQRRRLDTRRPSSLDLSNSKLAPSSLAAKLSRRTTSTKSPSTTVRPRFSASTGQLTRKSISSSGLPQVKEYNAGFVLSKSDKPSVPEQSSFGSSKTYGYAGKLHSRSRSDTRAELPPGILPTSPRRRVTKRPTFRKTTVKPRTTVFTTTEKTVRTTAQTTKRTIPWRTRATTPRPVATSTVKKQRKIRKPVKSNKPALSQFRFTKAPTTSTSTVKPRLIGNIPFIPRSSSKPISLKQNDNQGSYHPSSQDFKPFIPIQSKTSPQVGTGPVVNYRNPVTYGSSNIASVASYSPPVKSAINVIKREDAFHTPGPLISQPYGQYDNVDRKFESSESVGAKPAKPIPPPPPPPPPPPFRPRHPHSPPPSSQNFNFMNRFSRNPPPRRYPPMHMPLHYRPPPGMSRFPPRLPPQFPQQFSPPRYPYFENERSLSPTNAKPLRAQYPTGSLLRPEHSRHMESRPVKPGIENPSQFDMNQISPQYSNLDTQFRRQDSSPRPLNNNKESDSSYFSFGKFLTNFHNYMGHENLKRKLRVRTQPNSQHPAYTSDDHFKNNPQKPTQHLVKLPHSGENIKVIGPFSKPPTGGKYYSPSLFTSYSSHSQRPVVSQPKYVHSIPATEFNEPPPIENQNDKEKTEDQRATTHDYDTTTQSPVTVPEHTSSVATFTETSTEVSASDKPDETSSDDHLETSESVFFITPATERPSLENFRRT